MTERPKTVFVVEDSAVLAERLVSEISEMGGEIAGTATRPSTAIEFLNRHTPDIMVLDLALERRDDVGRQAFVDLHRVFPPAVSTAVAFALFIALILLAAHLFERWIDRPAIALSRLAGATRWQPA